MTLYSCFLLSIFETFFFEFSMNIKGRVIILLSFMLSEILRLLILDEFKLF